MEVNDLELSLSSDQHRDMFLESKYGAWNDAWRRTVNGENSSLSANMFKKNRSVSLKLPEDLRKPFQAQQKHECNPFFFFCKTRLREFGPFCLYLRPRRKLFRKPTWKVFVFPSPNGFVKSTPGSPWHSAGPGAGCEWTGPGARNWSFLGIYDIWVFSKIGVPQNGWFIMENSIKVGWFGGKTPIFGNIHIFLYKSLHNRQRFGAFSIFCWSTSQGVSVFTTWFKAAAATDWWKLVLEKKIMTGWAPKTHYLNMYILYEYFPNNLNPFNLTIHTVFLVPGTQFLPWWNCVKKSKSNWEFGPEVVEFSTLRMGFLSFTLDVKMSMPRVATTMWLGVF